MKKVFCIDCKYLDKTEFRTPSGRPYYEYTCIKMIKDFISDSPLKPGRSFNREIIFYAEQNKNNDCEYFEKKFENLT